MKNVITVWKELLANRERIFRLARYEQRAKNSGTILGRLWEFLTPVLQICVYWFVFSVGLRMKTVQGDTPYAVWMMTGMIPWFCLSGAMLSSATAITSASNVIRNLNIPMTIIPAKNRIVAQLTPADSSSAAPLSYQKLSVKMLFKFKVSITARPLCIATPNTSTRVAAPQARVTKWRSNLSRMIKTNIRMKMIPASTLAIIGVSPLDVIGLSLL